MRTGQGQDHAKQLHKQQSKNRLMSSSFSTDHHQNFLLVNATLLVRTLTDTDAYAECLFDSWMMDAQLLTRYVQANLIM